MRRQPLFWAAKSGMPETPNARYPTDLASGFGTFWHFGNIASPGKSTTPNISLDDATIP
jgi:hypothetical protein